mgnify:FL=1
MSIVKFELNETQLALQLRSTLEQADSCYTKEYLPFAQANAKLSDDAFVDTLERQFAAKLLYVAWQGVRWNLDCYRNPINKLRLQTDYEELHGEYLFSALPQVQTTEDAICSSAQRFTPEQQALAIQIEDYYSYLETIGFKLVHYWGFLWGNEFFPKVVPRYAADTVFTAKYTHMLEHDLGIILADQT